MKIFNIISILTLICIFCCKSVYALEDMSRVHTIIELLKEESNEIPVEVLKTNLLIELKRVEKKHVDSIKNAEGRIQYYHSCDRWVSPDEYRGQQDIINQNTRQLNNIRNLLTLTE